VKSPTGLWHHQRACVITNGLVNSPTGCELTNGLVTSPTGLWHHQRACDINYGLVTSPTGLWTHQRACEITNGVVKSPTGHMSIWRISSLLPKLFESVKTNQNRVICMERLKRWKAVWKKCDVLVVFLTEAMKSDIVESFDWNFNRNVSTEALVPEGSGYRSLRLMF
jgi:hypothetical protein